MNKRLRDNQKKHSLRLLFHFFVILTLQSFWCQTVKSNPANRGYTPPVDRDSNTAQRRQAAGSRGCGLNNNSTLLTLLVPKEQHSKSTSSNPTLTFDISSIPQQPIIVTLTQPNKIEPIFETEININRAGIWSVTAQPAIPLLENQQYVWTVMIVCNDFNPSQNKYVRFSFNYSK